MVIYIGMRDREGGTLPPQKKFGKQREIRVNAGKYQENSGRFNLSQNRLNSGDFITILHKTSDKLPAVPLDFRVLKDIYLENKLI
jgi:hypothetical protein